MVAEVLGLPRERVSVTLPDTDVTPFDQSTSSSRTVFSMGNAAIRAAREVADQLLEIGAGELEADAGDLELRDGFVQVAGVPERRLAIGDLFRARFGGVVGSLFGSHGFQSRGGVDPATGKGKASAFFFLSACAAEVEVDTETGKVRVVRLATAVDAGKAINPRQCHLQNEGSMLMSLGSSLFEEMVFDNGQPINCTFLSYLPPSIQDHPEVFTSLLVEHPHPDGPFGAKGMGEAALGPVEPAIGKRRGQRAGTGRGSRTCRSGRSGCWRCCGLVLVLHQMRVEPLHRQVQQLAEVWLLVDVVMVDSGNDHVALGLG